MSGGLDPRTELLRYWIAKYRRVFKPDYKVYGRRTHLADCYACVERLADGSFHLEVSRELSPEAVEAFVLHELAHVVAWEHGHTFVKTHGPEFGVAYALVWSKLKEE
jgi:hypothetical protein